MILTMEINVEKPENRKQRIAVYPPQFNLIKLIVLIIGFFIWGDFLEIALKNVLSLVYGEDSFREQILLMCGAVWHGRMNYIDWFFRPNFECDAYKFNAIAVHAFLPLRVVLSYIVAKFISNIFIKNEQKAYFRWVDKTTLVGWLIVDVIIVFLVAFNRAFLIGFSPDDNVWFSDFALLSIVHLISVFMVLRTYKWKDAELEVSDPKAEDRASGSV